MKKHNTLKVVLLTMLICAILTWVFEAAYFSGEVTNQGRLQMGLFDLFNYPLTALSYFGYISLYILAVGCFYGVLNKIPAYHTLLENVAKKFKKRGLVTISVMMVLIAVITSVCGLQLGLILFFPLISSIILLMGYDKIVASLVLVGSTMVGVIGTTYGYSNVSMLNSILQEEVTDNIGLKLAVLIGALLVLIINTILYVKKSNKSANVIKKAVKEEVKVEKVEVKAVKDDKVEKTTDKKTTSTAKKTTTKSKTTSKNTSKKKANSKSSKSKNNNKAAALDEEVIMVTNKKQILWPIVAGFCILFVVMILAFIPWADVFGIDAMTKATDAVTGFKIFKFAIFGKLLGQVNAFGSWGLIDMIFPIIFITMLLALIYKVKFDEVIDGMVEGAKKAALPAFVTLIIYTVLVITTYHPYQLTIYQAIIGKSTSLNVVTSSITGILSAFFNVEPAYAIQAVVPYYVSKVTNADVYPIIWVIYQATYGFTMIFAPTSVVLMSVLSYLGVSYKEWLKAIWKFLLELLVVLLIIFLILTILV